MTTDSPFLGWKSMMWPDARRGPWVLTLHFGAVNGRVECIGVDLRAFTVDLEGKDQQPIEDIPPQPVTTSALRSIRLATIADALKQRADVIRYFAEGPVDPPTRAQRAALEQLKLLAEPAKGNKGGRPGLGLDHFAKVAEIYSRAYVEGRRTPTRAVAAEFDVRPSTAAKYVAKARRLGLLGPTAKGKAGGIEPPAPQPKRARRPRNVR